MYNQEAEEHRRSGKCGTVMYYVWKICACLFSHVLLVSLVVAYCIVGAFTFQNLEQEHEKEVKRSISKIRENMTNTLWELWQNETHLHEINWTTITRNQLQTFENELIQSMKSKGWDGSEDEEDVQWTFTGALFYSIIVITTIGYGHIAPKTKWGKVVTIFYAILGIPLMLLCLSNIGDIMAQSFRFLYWRVCCYVCTRKPKRHHARREKSVRNTRPGSGRTTRSRPTSIRRNGVRVSTKSADSALGLSETRSLNSDCTECRYRDDIVSEVPVRNKGNRIAAHNSPSDSQKDWNYSGNKEVGHYSDNSNIPVSPVLSNKYAIERDLRDKQSTEFPTNKSMDNYILDSRNFEESKLATLPHSSSPETLRSSERRKMENSSPYHGSVSIQRHGNLEPPKPCRPRIMTPMGLAISRHEPQRRTHHSSRARENPDYVYYDDFRQTSYEAEDSFSEQNIRTKPVPIWLCVFLVVTYILCGATLFMKWEDWGFLNSAYFCFITLTTIGFGDYVPAQSQKENAEISIALCSLYLLFGIALLAMSFNLVQEEVINNVKSMAKRLGIVKDDEYEDSD